MAHSASTIAIAAASGLLKAGVVSLLIILVTRLPAGQQGLGGLAIASTTLQLLSILLIIYLTTSPRQRSDVVENPSPPAIRRWKYLLPRLLLPIFTTVVTIATLVLARAKLNDFPHPVLSQRPWTILLALFVVWIATIIMEISFYFTIYRRPKHMVGQDAPISHYSSAMTASDMGNANELSTIAKNHPRQSRPQSLSSPPLSPQTMHGNNSLRSSLTLAVRPATSKTKLLPYPRAYPRNSTATNSTVSNFNSSRQSQDSGLDTWDTSSVAPSIRETVLRSSPSSNNAATLSPIPGSRCPSPANILQDFPLPPSSAPTSIPTSPVLPPQQNFSRPCLRQRSASVESLCLADRSSSIAEEHIHPLFRTSSPNPAPAATPGTNVTAAPGSFEGLHINERILHKIRSEKSLNGSRTFHSPSSAGPSSPLANSSPIP